MSLDKLTTFSVSKYFLELTESLCMLLEEIVLYF